MKLRPTTLLRTALVRRFGNGDAIGEDANVPIEILLDAFITKDVNTVARYVKYEDLVILLGYVLEVFNEVFSGVGNVKPLTQKMSSPFVGDKEALPETAHACHPQAGEFDGVDDDAVKSFKEMVRGLSAQNSARQNTHQTDVRPLRYEDCFMKALDHEHAILRNQDGGVS